MTGGSGGGGGTGAATGGAGASAATVLIFGGAISVFAAGFEGVPGLIGARIVVIEAASAEALLGEAPPAEAGCFTTAGSIAGAAFGTAGSGGAATLAAFGSGSFLVAVILMSATLSFRIRANP